MKCVVLDLEFTDLVPDEDSDFETSDICIACAATVLSDPGASPMVWKPDSLEMSMTSELIEGLLNYLEAITSMGYILVTWGGMSSDFRMLQKVCPIADQRIERLALQSVDIP